MKKPFYKQPILWVFAFFIAGYFIVRQFSQSYISDEPLIIDRANPPEIIMYGTQSCMYCFIAKEFFNKHQLAYTEYDIEASDKHMQTFYLLGGRGTPLLIVNREIIHGYDEQLIRDAIKKGAHNLSSEAAH